jgi:tetratricopeptide (TPR) repeat protein
MNEHLTLPADDLKKRTQVVLQAVIHRRTTGELLTDNAVLAEFPELAEFLPAELAKLRLIQDAGIRADAIPVAETNNDWPIRTPHTSGYLRIRCPYCREPFELPSDTPVANIECRNCGSPFSLIDSSEETHTAKVLRELAHFNLIERLGIGGFGTVWKGYDTELHRTVAVKLPRQGCMTNQELEKFLREARAAAQLRHPNIVSVHEIGRDADGVFIVSDYIQGVSLDGWLTGQRPTTRQAAEMCLTIAKALQHAHEHGVIHRDLKPSNILIDANGEPHITDFGLARREAGEITVTLDGQILGTPAYMSPEQAQGEGHRADRRSDVYSLGVILFQLLTAELPFRGNARMLLHQVVHDEPPSPRKLNGSVPKDLETVTLKCLEKSPERRYQTAGEVTEELRRYLAGEPIHARPLGRTATTWRWAKKRPAAAALLVLLGLVAVGSAAAFVRERDLRRQVVAQKNEAVRQQKGAETRKKDAEAERASAEAVVAFLTDDILGKASPRKMSDKAVRDTLVKTLIEPAAATVGQRFKDKPLIEASVRNTLALTLDELGRSDLALAHAKQSLEQRRQILGDSHPETIQSLRNYALVLHSLGRTLEAEPLFRQALEQRRTMLGEDHPHTINSMNSYAAALRSLGRAQEAEPLYKQVLEQRRKLLGVDHPDTIWALNGYAEVLHSLGRASEAEPLYKQALEQHRKVLGEDHPSTVLFLNNHALVLESLGRAEEAAPLYKQALEQRRKILGDSHPETIQSLRNYALSLHRLGRTQEAEPLLRQALEQRRTMLGEDHPHTINSMNSYATVLRSLGRSSEAEPLYAQVLEQRRKILGADHPDTIWALNGYAEVLHSLGRASEAEPFYKQALEQHRKVLGEDHPSTMLSLHNHARVLESLGRVEEAAPLYKQALEQRRRVLGENHQATVKSLHAYEAILKVLEQVPLK